MGSGTPWCRTTETDGTDGTDVSGLTVAGDARTDLEHANYGKASLPYLYLAAGR